MVDLPDCRDYGYEGDDSTIQPTMMSQRAAPPELLSDLVCFCANKCTEDCVCMQNEQPCTVACSCNGCTDAQECCENIFTILAAV